MTLDEMIERLQELRERHGGEVRMLLKVEDDLECICDVAALNERTRRNALVSILARKRKGVEAPEGTLVRLLNDLDAFEEPPIEQWERMREMLAPFALIPGEPPAEILEGLINHLRQARRSAAPQLSLFEETT